MSKSKHTPGPWNVLIHGSCNDLTYRIAKPRLTSHDTASENVALIAAAPEMLEALEVALIGLLQVEDPLVETSDAIVAVKQVLKKARGES